MKMYSLLIKPTINPLISRCAILLPIIFNNYNVNTTRTIMQVEMAIDKAIETLSRLGLVVSQREAEVDGGVRVQAVGCEKAYEALKQHWNGLLT